MAGPALKFSTAVMGSSRFEQARVLGFVQGARERKAARP